MAKRKPKNPAPAHLDKAARAEWDRLVADLAPGRRLDLDTRTAVAGYCAIYSRWVRAESELAKLGPVVRSPGGYPVENPWLGIATKALEQMGRLVPDLSGSPTPKRPDRLDTAERIRRVVDHLVTHRDPAAARSHARDHLGLAKADAAELVESALDLIRGAAAPDRDQQRGTAVRALENIYAAASAAGDLKTALYAQRELIRLLGLDQPAAATAESRGEDRTAESRDDAGGPPPAAGLETLRLVNHG
jgi:P27 family predicted phage terminase small subunit